MALDMTGFKSLNRTPEQRQSEFNRLMELLSTVDAEQMTAGDRSFYDNMQERDSTRAPSEAQLAWMRDLVERYA